MNKLIVNVVAVMALGMASFAQAADEGRARLNNFFTTVNTMQASFIQEVFDANETLKQKSNGTVSLSRPGKFRWEYAAPDAHKIIADGKNVWVYDSELDQVSVKPMRQGLSSAPVGLLLNKQPVESQFAVQEMESQESQLDWFRLVPKKKDTDFTTMDLGLGPNGLQEMVLADKFGQQTYIHFQNMKFDAPVAAERFSFTPPEGADVIGNPS